MPSWLDWHQSRDLRTYGLRVCEACEAGGRGTRTCFEATAGDALCDAPHGYRPSY